MQSYWYPMLSWPEYLFLILLHYRSKIEGKYSVSIHIRFDVYLSLDFDTLKTMICLAMQCGTNFFTIIDQIFGLAKLSLDPCYLLFGLHFRMFNSFCRLLIWKCFCRSWCYLENWDWLEFLKTKCDLILGSSVH